VTVFSLRLRAPRLTNIVETVIRAASSLESSGGFSPFLLVEATPR